MPPTAKSRSRQVVDKVIDNSDDSDGENDDTVLGEKPTELFVDPLHGNPLICYVHEDVDDRSAIIRIIQSHGGGISSSYTNATYILVDPTTAAGQNFYILFHNNKKGKITLDAQWVRKCVKANKILAYKSNWGGCRVTGRERDDFLARQELTNESSQSIPSLDAATRTETDNADDDDSQTITLDQPNARGETPIPRQQDEAPQTSPISPQHADPTRHPQSFYYPSHPLIYGYPPPRPGVPIPSPMPWPYMPNGHPIPMPMAMTMFPPPSSGHSESPGGQSPTASMSTPAVAAYAPFDYQQAQGYNAWMEYYAQMDPNAYTRQMEEHSAYQYQPMMGMDAADNDKRRRGRTRTRNLNVNGAKIAVKALGPPARSPSPPTRVVKSTYGGNLFTEEDVQYLKRYIEYCQEQGHLLSLREICERLAVRAPHHTFFSWRRYCNKHQIRLGAYSMEDRQEDAEPNIDSAAQAENTDADIEDPSSSNPAPVKPPRQGSPIPPKTLYKSTTGKGVAFTPEDVQYLMEYMNYRKSQSVEPLDMVEFWNDLWERAPHHSRASWMKYWRRHRHELEPKGDQPTPPVNVAPQKKSRYTRKDDILLAKYFFEAEGAEHQERKTSDAIFQEFAALHSHHPWKGWQEHHRIHKSQIDHLIKQLKDGEEL